MSFSFDVKKELTYVPLGGRHCMIAELAAMIIMGGEYDYDERETYLRFYTENEAVARKYFTIIKKAFNIDTELVLQPSKKSYKKHGYMLQTKTAQEAEKILIATTLLKKENNQIVRKEQVEQVIIQSTCCKRAYLRGAFLGAGSVSNPEKSYHLEFIHPTLQHAYFLKNMMIALQMEPKIITRKGNAILYLKEGTQIVDLLNLMGAYVALMNLENVRIVKEVRNNVNRIVNCETANLKKTVSAAVRQIQDIEYIQSTIGISNLPTNLQQVALCRLQYPSSSLQELAELLKIGKSGVNHRLKKISEVAQTIRDGKEKQNV